VGRGRCSLTSLQEDIFAANATRFLNPKPLPSKIKIIRTLPQIVHNPELKKKNKALFLKIKKK